MNTHKSYFFQSFLIVFFSAVFFAAVKDYLPKRIFPENKVTTKNVLIDSMLIDAFEGKTDTIPNDLITKNDTLANQAISEYNSHGVTFPETDAEHYAGQQYLIPFFEKLYQLETNKMGNIRIAYFGDSMTDGDMIVQDFRSEFQNRFGGQGVGFVSITSESAQSRNSIKHDFSKNWKMQSYLNVKKPIRDFGVNGHTFFANQETWVSYNASKLRNLNSLFKPTLFYGSSDNNNAIIECKTNKDTITKRLSENNLLNTIVLSDKEIKDLKIKFKNASNVPIYGLNFDDGKGVHVDNFSQRGMSGIPISKFNTNLMRAFNEKLNYDLIVLHYGTNVLNYGTKQYDWYEKAMTKTVNQLKASFPGASILIISTADKSTKYKTEMKTDSAVVPLANSQKKYAIDTQSGFINLYTLMGGDGSMVKWVEQEPSMAGKDYTHFNQKGAKKIANLLYSNLISQYETYKKLRKGNGLELPLNNDSIQ